jgi:hypothetical protein
MRAARWLMGVCAFVPLLLVASQTCEVGPGGPQLWGYEVVAEFPHDPRAFTQGLQHDTVCNAQNSCSEVFWESTGMCLLLQQASLTALQPMSSLLVLEQQQRCHKCSAGGCWSLQVV